MTHPLYEFDETALPEFINPPEGFKSEVYTGDQMMHRLGVDDFSDFWTAVRDGRIPRPVHLSTSRGPMPVWDRLIVEEWISFGRPQCELHALHEKIVHRKLLDSVQDSLSPTLPTVQERN